MARRVLEREMLKKEGKENRPFGSPKSVTLVKEVRLHSTFRGIFSMQFNYTGDILIVGFGSGGIQKYDANTGLLVCELRACRQGGHSVMALRFHPKIPDLVYAATTEGQILIYNVTTHEEVGVVEERGNEINTLDFSVDGYNFATGGRDLGVRVYETKNNKVVQHYESITKGRTSIDSTVVNQTMRIFCLKFHTDNQYLFISGGWDNQLKIWDIRANDGIKRSIRGPHICGDSIDMSENRLLCGQWTAMHSLQEFDYTAGKVTKEYNFPHKDGAFLYCAQYANPNLLLAGGSGTNKAELVDSENKSLLVYDLGGPVQALDSARNGRIIAVGGAMDKFAILTVNDA